MLWSTASRSTATATATASSALLTRKQSHNYRDVMQSKQFLHSSAFAANGGHGNPNPNHGTWLAEVMHGPGEYASAGDVLKLIDLAAARAVSDHAPMVCLFC